MGKHNGHGEEGEEESWLLTRSDGGGGWDGLFEINGMEKKEKVGGRKE